MRWVDECSTEFASVSTVGALGSKPERHRGQAESRKSEMADWNGQLIMAQRQLEEVIEKTAQRRQTDEQVHMQEQTQANLLT
jgi:hypothetical protein